MHSSSSSMQEEEECCSSSSSYEAFRQEHRLDRCDDYDLLVVPNKFPVLTPSSCLVSPNRYPLVDREATDVTECWRILPSLATALEKGLLEIEAVGFHEVVVDYASHRLDVSEAPTHPLTHSVRSSFILPTALT
eukprot:GHVU01032172.1.p2 GENE.GHVU01032172.1~~GHVU01032172.1.p2  ORF type:complete len:134 (+),score=38.51 GHVU01032172.1:833-1234(+)